MSQFTVVDCNGLNGALSRGMVTGGGGKLLYRTGYLDLGRKLIAANAHLWGPDWEDLIDPKSKGKSETLPLPTRADVIVAVPPCSGFSVMTGKGGPGSGTGASVKRHKDHPSNECMWDTIRYAGRHAPQIVMFESVTGAFRIGQELMQELRAELELVSGERYTLTHWLHDGCVMGAPSSRQRYMFVCTKDSPTSRPFSVTDANTYAVENFTSVTDAIGDLVGLELKMGEQPLAFPKLGGAWAHDRQRADLHVDGMDHYRGPTWAGRILRTFEVGERIGAPWPQGVGQDKALKRIYEAGGMNALIEVAGEDFAARMVKVDFSLGPYSSKRECSDAMHSLIAGGGTGGHTHPTEDRFITYRELARIQGWPDELIIDIDKAVYGKEKIDAVWGKAVGCLVSEHAGEQVRDYLTHTGSDKIQGELIGEREWLIDELDHSRRLRRASALAKKAAQAGTQQTDPQAVIA